MIEHIVQNMIPPEAYIGRRVLIEKVEGGIIPAEVSGVDNKKGKVLVSSVFRPKLEFAAPLELVTIGAASNRSGHLRFELLPELPNLMRDPKQTSMSGNVWAR